MSMIFNPPENCWRVENASRAAVLIDGENYMRAVRSAMAKAQERIVLIGWDFDARIKMYDTEEEIEGPLEVGDYVDWLVKRNPKLHVHILRWNVGAVKSIFRGKTIFTILRWMAHPRIHLKLDDDHPAGAAQHSKVITLDSSTAFCGGIDLTENRWDTRQHEDENEHREQPDEDRGPWHDASMVFEGEAALALDEYARGRWKSSGGEELDVIENENGCWPDGLDADFENVDIAIARTRPEMDEEEEIREIEQLYVDMIESAEHHIYAESQYFASRKIANALKDRLEEHDGPEVVLLNPISSDGWLESRMMDTTRERLLKALMNRDAEERFRVYHPITSGGNEIYVHAKILIIDDQTIRIGSSNFNNRSMGFDTECDIAIDAGDGTDASALAVRRKIADIRADLIAEHLDCSPDEVREKMQETGSLIDTIQLLRKTGKTLRDYRFPENNTIEEWLAEHDIFNAESADDEFAKFDPSFR